MSKKLPTIIASTVAFVFLLLSIAHACPSLASTNSLVGQTAIDMSASDHSPCGKASLDLCKSVRDTMLSVKPSDAGIDSLVRASSAPPLSFVSSNLVNPAHLIFAPKLTSHLVFKPRLSFSYLVLRI